MPNMIDGTRYLKRLLHGLRTEKKKKKKRRKIYMYVVT